MSEDVEASEETETETDTRKTVTIVVPVYNEAENIPHFVTAVDEAMAGLPYDYEILFVDDGSREESREVLRVLLGVLHTCAGSSNRRFELVALGLLAGSNGGGAGAVLHGVLGITAVRKAHGRVLANLAADVLDRILISNFSHSGF